ncbi:MAG: cob(I)yrinic acid a,c-diamide adenosyltransferase [Tissierellia bacterium]|nr:cob(I)yrinic acid a,c-diamide adenosyltransferase [Tissierellia bacterium]
MSKIYTKGGDKGQTSLYDGVRISKGHVRVESYGTLDELGAALGVAKNFVEDQTMVEEIEEIQKKLFTVSAILATEDPEKTFSDIREEDIVYLEELVDKYMGQLHNPNNFILNGSGTKSCFLHLARTICRRGERRIIALDEIIDVDPLVVKYVNRLSDALYAMARYNEDREEVVEFQKK